MAITFKVQVGEKEYPKGRATKPSGVLELRVHGVDNTTAASLLDLRPEDVERVAGDKLGSFWRPTPAALSALRQGQRGYVPPGIVREAYSWGGMVRTTPDLGRAGAAGVVAATVARVLYALILPFSIGNAVQWSRRLSSPSDALRTRVWAAITAGAGRLFGMLLTLLFTATAITVALDVLAAQCGAEAALCTPVAGILEPLGAWTTGQRFALFALAPVLAVVGLWLLSAIAGVRYDVLPGMEWHSDEASGAGADDAPRGRGLWRRSARIGGELPPPDAPTAVLAHPGFWANRIVGDLARVHLAAAILLTTAVTALNGAMRWYTECTGIGGWETCVGDGAADAGYQRLVAVAIIAGCLLAASVVLACIIPTMAIEPHERDRANWHAIATTALLVAAVLTFAVLLWLLVFLGDVGARPPERLYGGGMMVLVIVTAAAAIAFSGMFWRPFRGRRHVGWNGCGPALFMTLSLVVAVATSAIVVVTAGDWLNGSRGAAALVRGDTTTTDAAVETAWATEVRCRLDAPADGLSPGEAVALDCTAAEPVAGTLHALTVPSAYVALGSLFVVGLLVGVVLALAAAARRRDVTARALAWHAPASPDARIVDVDDGVLPVSRTGLYRRIAAKRTTAARLHIVEPLTGMISIMVGIAGVTGLVWVWRAYAAQQPLWDVVPSGLDPAVVTVFLAVAMPVLAWIGILITGLLAAGAVGGGQRPLGTAWDIACYLPRTGHPFGPPTYAERAVPEIAGRVFAWLREDESRRIVVSAHSMGGVLAVSAMGLLASSPQTRGLLPRVRLLTFGVQLRAFFGRMLPELLGPAVLGTEPCLAPRALASDPWAADLAAQTPRHPSDAPAPRTGRLRGTLLTGGGVKWLSLWRLTDYLGFPAASTSTHLPDGRANTVDRFAEELDLSGYMVEVGTHSAYYRTPAYETAVEDLLAP